MMAPPKLIARLKHAQVGKQIIWGCASASQFVAQLDFNGCPYFSMKEFHHAVA